MSQLEAPNIVVSFREAGQTAVRRGSRGVVALILRDSAEMDPVALRPGDTIPAELTEDNKAAIRRAFMGYVNQPKKVLVYVTEARESEPDETLAEPLKWLAGQEWDWLAGPTDCTANEAEAIANWIKKDNSRKRRMFKHKAVVANHEADDENVVNFTATGMTDGTKTYTTAEYCSRIAGLLAGTPLTMSATNAPLTELTGVDVLDEEAEDAAVAAGKFVLVWDGSKVKTSLAVNSLTTTGGDTGKGDGYKKIIKVEVMDLFRTDIYRLADETYSGKYKNTYDNKVVLLTAIDTYLEAAQRADLIVPGYTVDIDIEAQYAWLKKQAGSDRERLDELDAMNDQQIKVADTDSYVFIGGSMDILDAMEHFRFAFAI